MSFSILGTGSKSPSLEKTNNDLSKIMDTSDEWIVSRTGIRSRMVLGKETVTDIAVASALEALVNSGLTANDLDLIICATVKGEYVTPSMACQVQSAIGAECPAFDINAACSGFVYAFDVAEGYFARNPDSKILVIGAEHLSNLVNWKDRSTAVIFADGAGAVVLGKATGRGMMASTITAKGNTEFLYAKSKLGNSPYYESEQKETDEYLHMDGQNVFKFAVSSMWKDMKTVVKQAGIEFEDITYVLPHQANLRIIDYAVSKLPIPEEKYLLNIGHRGNMSAAAIPVLLDEYNKKGKFKRGDFLLMTVFGAGLTSAACIIEW